jgi:hypothetical protein
VGVAAQGSLLGPIIGMGLNKILPKSELDQWRDAYLEATLHRNLNNASKYDKIISAFLKQTPDLENVSSEDKKDLLLLLNELNFASSPSQLPSWERGQS